MTRIQQLDHHIINKFAAGEVIERPASAVKELLENSIDALATRVEVDVVAGGTELIRIVDNGEGIHPDDLLLAVTSHATSKLREADDLFRVQTMGFRGEALASIAEVSRFRLRSRRAEFPHGHELEVNAGVVGPVVECGCPVGTTIEVRDLFCNLPVRRKYLRQGPTEFGHVSEQFTRLALANPRVHLVLRHNDRMIFELPASASVLERIELFCGNDTARQLIAVDAEFQGIRLWGYIGHPSENRSTRKGQYLFLNGRWIQDRSLQHALTEAYRGLLMVGRNPITYLFLEVPPEAVDVNVHPTKSEVRFLDSQRLYRLVLSTIRNRFLGMDLNSTLTPGGAGGGVKLEAVKPKAVDPATQRAAQEEFVNWTAQQMTRQASLWRPAGPDAGDGAAAGGTAEGVDEMVPLAPGEWPRPTPAPSSVAGGSSSAGDQPYPAHREPAPWGGTQQPSARTSEGSWQRGGDQHTGGAAVAGETGAVTAPWEGAVSSHAGGVSQAPRPSGSPARDFASDFASDFAQGTANSATHATAEWGTSAEGPTTQGNDSVGEQLARQFAGESGGTSVGVPTEVETREPAERLLPPRLPDNVRAMQIHDAYLVVETAEGLQVVDQHALHERIMYEALRKRVLGKVVETQRLLVPVPVDLTAPQVAALLEHADLLGSFGVQFREFSGQTVLLTGYPVMLKRVDPTSLLKDLAEQILETGRDPSRRDLLDSLLHSMSCKAAVKAGQRLTQDEIESLLTQRHLIDDAHHCPHGRPTALVLSRSELDRQFGRLG